MHVLEQAKELLSEFVAAFEPALYSGADAEKLVGQFDEIARLAGAGKVLASKQVAATGAWKAEGYASKEDWYARRTGTSRSDAAAELATAERLNDLPDTDAAFRSGKLTAEQAAAVSSAAEADPSAERKLLDDAGERSLSGLRQECQRVRHAAGGASAQNRDRIHRSRYLRHWTDEDGAFMIKGRMTPEDGAALLAGLTPHRKKVFDAARQAGRRERSDAYELDALMRMARTPGTAVAGSADETGPLPQIVLRVDYPAFLRGYTMPGETSELVGVGPVPIETVRRYAEDAIYRVVLWDGEQIRDLRTVGRNIPSKIRRALLERDRRCCVPGCEHSQQLEIHHLVWVKAGGPTALDNLARVCTFHHDQITYQRAHLAGPYPNWVWYPPGTKPAGVRGFYDPAPPEVLDGLDVEHDPDPVGHGPPVTGAGAGAGANSAAGVRVGGAGPPGQLF